MNLASIPLYGAQVRPHLEYGMPVSLPNLVADINHLERIQRFATRLETGIRHLSTKSDCSGWALQRRQLRADRITDFRIFTDLFYIDQNLICRPLARGGLRVHPYNIPQGAKHHQRRRSAFSERVVNYWNKHPASVVATPSINVFKKSMEKVME